jgi:uncharacterized membrane protein
MFEELARRLSGMVGRADNHQVHFALMATTWVEMVLAIYLVKCLAAVVVVVTVVLVRNVGPKSKQHSRSTSPMPHMA